MWEKVTNVEVTNTFERVLKNTAFVFGYFSYLSSLPCTIPSLESSAAYLSIIMCNVKNAEINNFLSV